MRSRKSTFKITIHTDLYATIGLIVLAGLIIWYLPPSHIGIICALITVLSIALYLAARHFIHHTFALIGAMGIGMLAFLYGIDMFDAINSMLVISLLISIGILIHQK
jgi:hypothetical protein